MEKYTSVYNNISEHKDYRLFDTLKLFKVSQN